jgi:hypothetical protein
VTKKVIRKIDADLVEILFVLPPGESHLDWVKVSDVHLSDSRWESWHWLVVEDPQGDFWAVSYGMGLTENQDNTFPWKGGGWGAPLPETVDAFRVDAFRVVPRLKTVIEYDVWDDDETP